MNDLISRQMAIDALCTACNMEGDFHKCDGYNENSEWCEYMVALRRLPSAQPEQTKGHWINAYPDIEPNPMFMYGICSVCGFEQALSNKLNYCPNCGAKMEESE